MKTLSLPLLLTALAASIVSIPTSDAAKSNPPNIVLIISDDMGYSDLGCYGGEIETPHLDSLATQGIRFTNYYVNNMCWPTRASLMTGLYPKSVLADGSADGGLRPELTTLPEALKRVGYQTFMTGKWHLSEGADLNGPSAPHKRGFDRTYSTFWGTTDYFAPSDLNVNGELREYEWKNRSDYYQTDAITDYALRFMKERTEEKPFFLYVAYNAAHWPLHAKPEDIAHYKGRYAMGWDTLRQDRYERMQDIGLINSTFQLSPRHPNVPAWEGTPHKAWQQRRMEVYAAQVTCMDRNIGRLIQYLKDDDIFENTLFIYQHDNGACHVEYPPTRTGSWTKPFTTDGKNRPIHPGNLPDIMPGDQSTWQSYGYGWANASNTPFRLFKQHDHEGGDRSPLVVSWPSEILPASKGGFNRKVCHVIDLMPTLMDAAGVPSFEQNPLPFEGDSILPALKGETRDLTPSKALFWEHSKGKAVRDGEWKLVSENKRPWELYNLADDPTELSNLAEEMPEKVASLEKLHNAWRERTNLTQSKH